LAHLPEKNAAPLSVHNIHNGNVQKPSSRCKGHSGVSRAANQQTSLSHQPTLASNALKCNHASLPSAHSSTSSKTLEIYMDIYGNLMQFRSLARLPPSHRCRLSRHGLWSCIICVASRNAGESCGCPMSLSWNGKS
jgi:hypothetical protein